MASTIQELEQILQRIKEVQVTQVQLKPLLSEKYSFIPCYKGSNSYHINGNEIECATSSPNTGVHLRTKNGEEYHTSKTLKELEGKTTLTRCHMQHLIDMKSIKMVEVTHNGTGIIHTHSDHSLPTSRRCMDKYRF
jgi:two-component system LytT family response regulator